MVYAQKVKDRRITTFKCTIDLLVGEIHAGLATAVWAELPIIWGPVYNWFRLGLEEAHRKALAVPDLSNDEPPDASRD